MNEKCQVGRLESLDVARGIDMFCIMGGASLFVAVCGLFGYDPQSALAQQMEHPEWAGLRFIDFVFPTFIFIAGISFPFSLASQQTKGRTTAQILLRILKRTLALILLGYWAVCVFVVAPDKPGLDPLSGS